MCAGIPVKIRAFSDSDWPMVSHIPSDSGLWLVAKRGHPLLEPLIVSILCAAICVLVVYPALKAAWFGVSEFQDDTFYYLVTAKNFLRHGFFTFDGTNATNGFQPSWMAAIVVLYSGLGVDSPLNLQIFAVSALEKVVLAAAVATSVGFYIKYRRQGSPWACGFLAASVLLLCPYYVIFDRGMETTLAVLLLLIVIYAFVSDRFTLLGVALALLFLTRLDTAAFVATPLLLWTLFRSPRFDRSRWPGLAAFCVTFCIFAGVNLALTGHVVPISGALKSSFPAMRWQGAFFVEPITLASMFGWVVLLRGINIVTCTLLVVVGLGLMAVARPAKPERDKVLILSVIAVLLLANLLMFQKWDKSIDPRYLAMPMLVATIIVATVLAQVIERAQSWALAARGEAGTPLVKESLGRTANLILPALPYALICVLLLLEGEAHLSRFDAYADRKDDLVRQIYDNVSLALPSDAVIAGTDVGALAFWTQRRVVNLDGLINNFEYQEYLRRGALRDYLRREGVNYLATALWDREQNYTGRPIEPMYRQLLDPRAAHGTDYDEHQYYVYSYLYNVYSDSIALTPGDEVYRRNLGKEGVADVAYVIYRLPR